MYGIVDMRSLFGEAGRSYVEMDTGLTSPVSTPDPEYIRRGQFKNRDYPFSQAPYEPLMPYQFLPKEAQVSQLQANLVVN